MTTVAGRELTTGTYPRQVSKGWVVFLMLQALVLVQVPLAWADGFLTVSDMQQRGYPAGLPLVWHFGVWGDLLLISPLTACVIARYVSQWSVLQICIVILVSISITAFLGWFYTTGSLPGSHAHDHQTTLAGLAHLIYMAGVVTVFGLFYLCTRASVQAALCVTLLVVAHVFCGAQLAIGLLKRFIHLPWYPHQPLHDPTAWGQFIAVVMFCAWCSWHMRKTDLQGA